MQYSKKEVPLEDKDIKQLKTLNGFVIIFKIAAAFILGMLALAALLIAPAMLGWTTALIIVAVIIAGIFLALFLIDQGFLKPINTEIKNGVKLEHRGVLTNKRDEMVYTLQHGKHRLLQTFFITLNDVEIRMGDVENYTISKLHETLQLNKNYRVSQSVRDAYIIFGVEEIK